ncbi:glycosyltransferase [Streptomyces sp. URMC 127]|uniref:glycosyltransferase n=1 Tax=Streptomyces sp. URMC 127 TaxID=3423402 RepID=UPI003F19C372
MTPPPVPAGAHRHPNAHPAGPGLRPRPPRRATLRPPDGNPHRIALISEHASPLAVLGGVDAGGQNVHVAHLAQALAARGHSVAVYTRRDDPAQPAATTLSPGVEVRLVPAGPPAALPKDELLPYMDEFARLLVDAWEDDPPDIVHSHYWMSGVAGLAATRRLGLPLVHTYHALGTVKKRHQPREDTSPPRRIPLETAVGRGCRRIIATCRDEVRELLAMGIPDGRAAVVPCGVDAARFSPYGPAAPRGRHPHRLVQVGRLVRRKGAGTAVAALRGLPDTELVIVGGPPPGRLHEDPEACRLRALARETGVADRVRFTGGVPPERILPLLRSADVVLCPADYEPFGIVPLEAMACGVPVVATAVGGQLDTVADPATGCLVPPGDPARLAEAVAALLADPARRAGCGIAGRRRVLERYGWDRVAAATEDVYRGVMSRHFTTGAAAATRASGPDAA